MGPRCDPKVVPWDQINMMSKSYYYGLLYPPMVRDNFLKKAKIRKTGFNKNRQVLKMFYLTGDLHMGI